MYLTDGMGRGTCLQESGVLAFIKARERKTDESGTKRHDWRTISHNEDEYRSRVYPGDDFSLVEFV